MAKIAADNTYADVTQFWYINRKGEIYHDKKILYKEDGHRDHRYGGSRDFHKRQGLFRQVFIW